MIAATRTCLAIVAALCASAAAAQAQTKITLGYSASSAFSSAYVAAEQGFFKKRGLDVEMLLVPNSSTTPAALIAGSVQVATPTPPVTLQAIENGLDLVVIAGGTVLVKDSTEYGALAGNASGIKTAADFVGKRVATPGLNAFHHIMFRQWLLTHGVDYNKVTFTESAFAQLPDLVRSGQVDAILTAEPTKTRTIKSGAGYLVANYGDVAPGSSVGWFVATASWAKANRAAAEAFSLAIADAVDWAKAHPDDLLKAQARYMKLTPELLADIPFPSLNAAMSTEQVSGWSAILLGQKLLKKPVDSEKVILK
jgi:NitT/TauT family transport system substrate-binding protein